MTDWIDEIEKLAAEASPGPWKVSESGVGNLCDLRSEPHDDNVLVEWSRGAYLYRHDAEFIAASREAVPRLVALVRRYEKVIQWAIDYEPTPEQFLHETLKDALRDEPETKGG